MGFRASLARGVNTILAPLGAQLITRQMDCLFDASFARWIAEAQASGRDPNDIGDAAWSDDLLTTALEHYYLPHISEESTVLELGPGTGRMTRHIIPRCREMILVDHSALVCNFLRSYLKGKGRFRAYRIDSPAIPSVEDESVDVALANGVFEHFDPEEVLCFLEEFFRVLKSGGVAAFNFDNLMNEQGMAWLRKAIREPSGRCIFRFYHPEMMVALAKNAGFTLLHLSTDQSRFAYIELQKP